MLGKFTRILLISLPALALAACGPSGDAETAKQLADAKATSDRSAAERDAAALRAQAREAALAEFYAGDGGGDEQDAAPDDGADSRSSSGNYDPPADDAPPANPEAPQPRIAGA